MKRSLLFVLLLVVAGGCTRRQRGSAKPAPRPPDLIAGSTGGARTLMTFPGFRYVPKDAVVVGLAEPGLILGAPAWLARTPGLTRVVQRLRTGGYDPGRTRLLFFGVVGGQGRLAAAVLADGRLAGVPGARREKVGAIEVHRFDGAATGLAWAPGVTLAGREPALERALRAGREAGEAALGPAGFKDYQGLFERMPARALLRFAALMRPALVALAQQAARQAPGPLADLLRTAAWVRSLGLAVYEFGSRIHLTLVLRLRAAARAPAVAARAGRAFSALRLPPGEVSREPLPSLADAALAGVRIRHRGEYVFAETSVPTDLVVAILGR